MRSTTKAVIIGTGLLAAFAGTAQAQGFFSKDAVAAKLGGSELRSSAFLRTIQAQAPETRKLLREKPESLPALARNEVVRRAVIDAARLEAFDKRPAVEVAMERAAEQALIDRYVEAKTAPEAGFPEAKDVEAAYQANKANFNVPARAHLAQILLRVPAEATKKEADRIAARAREAAALAEPPADFGVIAKQYSEDKPGNEKGGDAGWIDVATLLPEVRDAIAPLAAGGVSKPVKTRFGWQIFKLVERKDAYVRPLAEVGPAIATAMRKQKAEENKQKWLATLQAGGITVEEAALADIRKKIE